MVDTDDEAPGWSAIDAALERIYPDVEPLHYGTIIKWALGGPDPLDGISIYPREDHWHIVSYGMSELYVKESSDPAESGWGFEFTFRPARSADETEPPMWAVNFLQNLARYVFTSGNPFGPAHHMNLNGPISLAHPGTQIRAAMFTEDPELGAIDTPHGRLRFLQVVGLTLNEYAAVERWNARLLLKVLAPRLPLFVTDLARDDLTADPRIAMAIDEGARRDGSSTGALFVDTLGWRAEPADGTTVTFGANAAERIGRALAGRLPFERELIIEGADTVVEFRPDIRPGFAGDEGLLEIRLTPPAIVEVLTVLRPLAGVHPIGTVPGLTIEIVKSQIVDPDGVPVREVG